MKPNLLLSALFVFFIIVSGCKKDAPIESIEPKPGDFPKQLTQDNLEYRAFLSPDGKYIAFYSMRYTFNPEESGINFELWIMNSDGFDQWRLVTLNSIYPETKATFLYWADDSKSMIVQIDDGYYNGRNSEIWSIAIDGKKAKIFAPNLHLEKLSYSPDRTRIVYLVYGNSQQSGNAVDSLYVSNADFSNRVLIEAGESFGEFNWQADSKSLIYSLYDLQNKNFDLWKCKVDGTGKSRFSETPESKEYFSISSDGKYLAYSVNKSTYITPSEKFLPKLILNDASSPYWIPNRNLLLVYNEQTDGNGSYWGVNWLIDTNGNIIKKFPKGVGVSFSTNSKYYLYTQDGNIWIDYLP